MLLNDNNNLIKKVTFFYDSKNTNMAGPPSSQSELSYEHTYVTYKSKRKNPKERVHIEPKRKSLYRIQKKDPNRAY